MCVDFFLYHYLLFSIFLSFFLFLFFVCLFLRPSRFTLPFDFLHSDYVFIFMAASFLLLLLLLLLFLGGVGVDLLFVFLSFYFIFHVIISCTLNGVNKMGTCSLGLEMENEALQ